MTKLPNTPSEPDNSADGSIFDSPLKSSKTAKLEESLRNEELPKFTQIQGKTKQDMYDEIEDELKERNSGKLDARSFLTGGLKAPSINLDKIE